MGLYQYLSGSLTIAGYVMLTYRSIFQLSSEKSRLPDILQNLCIKWIILLLFIHFQPTIQSVFQILPLGTLAALALKFILILPENTLASLIYKRFEKQLQKIKFQEYSSAVTVHISSAIKYVAIKMVKLAEKMVVYINSHEIDEVERSILEMITAIEYKKAAVIVRSEGGVSGSTLRRQFTRSDSLNDTIIDEGDGVTVPTNDRPLESPRPSFRKSEIGEKMERVLGGGDNQEKDYKLKAKMMTVKPDKQTGQKGVFEQISIDFKPKTRDILFIAKGGAVIQDVLLEIKYVTKDMMVLELVLGKSPSKVIKLQRVEDVIGWMKPIVEILVS